MKAKTLSKSLLLTILFMGAFSTLILSKCVYVGSCSESTIIVNPGESIAAAINNASYGDTILVKSGNYLESEIIVNKNVTIIGEGAEKTIIDGGGTADYIFHIIASHVIVENFTIKNTKPSPSYSYAIRIYSATNVTVKNVMITNVVIGIDIQSSNHTKVMDSRINGTKSWGARLSAASCNNTIAGNNFEDNPTAIFFTDTESKFNKVYHNNFINSTWSAPFAENYFDDGYPSGGNYWSDYAGVDLKSGPYQNETGSDGILDEGYPEPSYPWDRYPLANPLTILDVAAEGESFEIKISTNSTVNSCNFDKEAKKLTTHLSGSEGTNGSCRISIPKRLLSCDLLEDWNVSINNNPIDYLALDDENSTYLYFTYNHTGTEEAIEIGGTKVIPEFDSVTILTIFAVNLLLMAIIKKRLGNKFQRNMRI